MYSNISASISSLGRGSLPQSHTIHKDRVSSPESSYRDSYGGISEGKSLSDIFLDLLHGLRRKGIDEVDRNIVKTSQLQTIDIVIDILLLMAPTNLFDKRLSKVCTPKETRLTGEFFKTRNLIRIQITRIGLDG